MSRKVRVNVVSTGAPSVRRETISGREKIVVSSATLPDDIVMNDILYSSDEIEKSFASLDSTPAPLGHPHLDGNFISASHTESAIRFGVGAYNTNVRRENGRVLLDKVIDVEFASLTDRGKRVLDHVERGEPIHTSTGLVCTLVENSGEGYTHSAQDIIFDHDAILLDERGAAGPDKGVGMLVNTSLTHAMHRGERIEVLNSEVADEFLEMMARDAVRVLDDEAKQPVVDRIVSAIRRAFHGETVSNEETDMSDNSELARKLDDLSGKLDKMPQDIANSITESMKPVTEAVTNMQKSQESADQAEREELVQKIVNARDLDEETAKELSLASLRRRSAAIQGGAAPLNNRSGRSDGGSEKKSEYTLPGDK